MLVAEADLEFGADLNATRFRDGVRETLNAEVLDLLSVRAPRDRNLPRWRFQQCRLACAWC